MTTAPAAAAPPLGRTRTSADGIDWVAAWQPAAARLQLLRGSADVPQQAGDSADLLVLFDGVLYNGPALAAQLPGAAGTDAAGLLALAYRRWGSDLPSRLRGVFALLIADRRHGRLLAVRDPLGGYPLFYAEAGDRVLFSTSLDALLDQPGVARTPNLPGLAEHLLHQWTAPDETYYATIRRLRPGHWLRIAGETRHIQPYWRPLAAGPVAWAGEDEVAGFDGLMQQAVARCVAQGRPAVWLSGGIDSATVAMHAGDLAQQAGDPPPWALCVDFPDLTLNEETVQRQVAACLGLPRELVPFADATGGSSLLEESLQLTASWPAPLWGMFTPVYYHLSQRGKRHGCTIILTGSGGDEALSAGPHYAAHLMAAGEWARLAQYFSVFHRSYKAQLRYNAYNVLWVYGLRALLGNQAARRLRDILPAVYSANRHQRAARLTAEWITGDPALRQTVVERLIARMPQAMRGSLYLQQVRHELEAPLLAMEAEEAFELGRRLGMRVLQPFWDVDVLNLLYRTRPERLQRGGWSKAPAREALNRRCPHAGFATQVKVGALHFFQRTIVRDAAACWQRLGGTPALARLGVVDASALAARLAPTLAGSDPRGAYQLWNVLRLETWAQTHF